MEGIAPVNCFRNPTEGGQMRIEWAIPCRYCEVSGNEISILGGNADMTQVTGFPCEVSTWIALRVVAPADEAGPDTPHRFSARILDPQMQVVPGSEVEIDEFYIEPHPLEGWETEQVVPSLHTFMATDEGAYTIELKVDDRSKTVTFHVLPDEAQEPDKDEA